MSYVGNENYEWDLEYVLGSGTFGNVYQGRQRHNGEPVAIKVFKNSDQQGTFAEYQLYKLIDHENLVKIISVEWHPEQGLFLAMELCSEGSLQKVLEEPKNFYGLTEKEFSHLLLHITAAIKYLRSKNIVHRDIKPGNILKSRNSHNQFIYKLTDFGSARILNPGEFFSSIHGTKAYMLPDMYGAAFKKSENMEFGPNCDLWSFGVTLYQAATGQLPFQPFEGNWNRSVMYEIVSKKPKGAIAGREVQINGRISWMNNLPSSCPWNSEFKIIITQLLSNLLEANSEPTWSFRDFFNEVNEIGSLREVIIFHVNCLKFLVTYLKPNEGKSEVMEAIARQTTLKPDDLLQLNEKEEDDFSAYTKTEPLFLISRGTSEYRQKFLNIDQLQNHKDMKQLLANVHIHETVIDDLMIMYELCKSAVRLSRINQDCFKFAIQDIIDSWNRSKNVLEKAKSSSNALHSKINEFEVSINRVRSVYNSCIALETKNNILKDAENLNRESTTLQTKLKGCINFFINYKNEVPRFAIDMINDLINLYPDYEAKLTMWIGHMNEWYESVFNEIKMLKVNCNQLEADWYYCCDTYSHYSDEKKCTIQ